MIFSTITFLFSKNTVNIKEITIYTKLYTLSTLYTVEARLKEKKAAVQSFFRSYLLIIYYMKR